MCIRDSLVKPPEQPDLGRHAVVGLADHAGLGPVGHRGAVKVRVPGGETVYAVPALPKDAVAPEEHLRRVCSEWVVEVSHSHNLVVLRTPPGSAHVVGSALDRAGLPEVLGTVAGDDTLLLVAAESTTGQVVARRISDLAGL